MVHIHIQYYYDDVITTARFDSFDNNDLFDG